MELRKALFGLDKGVHLIPFQTPDGVADSHALRATCCTDLGRQPGMDLQTLMTLTRHKTPDVVARYLKTNEDRRREAVARLSWQKVDGRDYLAEKKATLESQLFEEAIMATLPDGRAIVTVVPSVRPCRSRSTRPIPRWVTNWMKSRSAWPIRPRSASLSYSYLPRRF